MLTSKENLSSSIIKESLDPGSLFSCLTPEKTTVYDITFCTDDHPKGTENFCCHSATAGCAFKLAVCITVGLAILEQNSNSSNVVPFQGKAKYREFHNRHLLMRIVESINYEMKRIITNFLPSLPFAYMN